MLVGQRLFRPLGLVATNYRPILAEMQDGQHCRMGSQSIQDDTLSGNARNFANAVSDEGLILVLQKNQLFI